MRRLGADQTPGPRRVTLSSEDRPLLAVSESSWEPACCVVACPLDFAWSLAIAVVQRTEAVCRASVLLSQVLVEAGVTPAVHLHGPAPLATPHHNPHSARLARRRRTRCNEVAVRAQLDGSTHLGPPCSDDPVSNSAVTGALVAGCAVT